MLKTISFWRISIAGFILAIMLLAVVAWIAYIRIAELQQATAGVRHTLLVRAEAEELLSLVKDAETGERGFIITGIPSYLSPYENALASLPFHIEKLRRLTSDNTSQHNSVVTLDSLIQHRIQLLRDRIAVRQRSGFRAASNLIKVGEGKRVMDEIRTVTAAIIEEENILTTQHEEIEIQQAQAAFATTVGGLVGAVVILIMATFLLSRAIRSQEKERAARTTAEAIVAAVSESEEKLRVTVHSIGDGIITTDEQGLITRLNPVAEALTGWNNAEAAGQPLEKVLVIINEFTRKPAQNPVHRVLSEGVITGLANHTILISKNGKEIPIDDSAAPIKTAEGKMVGVVMVFRDISERRQAEHEEALRLNDKHTRILTRAEQLAHMGSWSWEPKTDKLMWSGELFKIYGIKSGTPLSFETFIERIHPDDRARVRTTITTAMKEGKPFRFQERIVRPDAEVRMLDSQGDVELDKKGKVISLFGFCRDVTEEQRSEDDLSERKELYEKLLEAQSDAGDGVAITEGTRLIYANEALSRMYGYTTNELKKLSSLLDIVVPEERERLAENLRRRLEGKKVDDLGATQVIRKDGKRIYNEYAVKPVQIKNKTLIISIVRDVTEQKQAQTSLLEKEQRFAKMFHASPVATVLVTLDHNRFLDINARFLELTGYTRKELVGHSPHLLSFGNSTREHRRLMESISEAKSVREVQVTYKKRNGEKSRAIASIELIEINGQSCLLILFWRV